MDANIFQPQVTQVSGQVCFSHEGPSTWLEAALKLLKGTAAPCHGWSPRCLTAGFRKVLTLVVAF